jgi:hypothetical protein
MNLWKKILCLVLTLNMAPLVFAQKAQSPNPSTALRSKIRRFAPTMLTANTSQLSVRDRQALRKIIAAAKYYDPLYRRQIWSGNEALLKTLQRQNPARSLASALFSNQPGPMVAALQPRTVHRRRTDQTRLREL